MSLDAACPARCGARSRPGRPPPRPPAPHQRVPARAAQPGPGVRRPSRADPGGARTSAPTSTAACPICEADQLRLVTYVFGSRLPAHGRCVTTAKELRRPRPASRRARRRTSSRRASAVIGTTCAACCPSAAADPAACAAPRRRCPSYFAFARRVAGRCVSVLAAADFADFEAVGDANVLAAADAAAFPVVFFVPVCANALAAAALDAFDAVGDRSVFPAADAAALPVRSDLAIGPPWIALTRQRARAGSACSRRSTTARHPAA